MSHDPFAETSESERTVIRPRPGGRTPERSAPKQTIAPDAPLYDAPVPAVGANPLLAAAAPLLAAAIRISATRGGGPDVETLRRGMVDAVRAFEKAALTTGLPTKSLRAARYALCATIDDIVLSTPWGASSSWAQQTLTGIFHNEVTGGERFFEILDQMSRELGQHAEVVELMYLCTSLGFEGRYRVMPRGVAALAELRDGIYRAIRTRRGEFERELSPHWRGIDSLYVPLSQRVPAWAIGLAALTMIGLMYIGFNYSLAGASDIAFADLLALPPGSTPPPVPRTENAPPPPAATAMQLPAAKSLHSFLAPEIVQKLVVVFEDAQAITIRLANKSMFSSGSAELADDPNGLLGRIGDALQGEPGQITVNGYTDSQPIRSARFPSNFELSRARADAVAAIIATHLSDPSRIHAQGKGEADPVAPNDTPEHRQANRRTEIVLVRSAEP